MSAKEQQYSKQVSSNDNTIIIKSCTFHTLSKKYTKFQKLKRTRESNHQPVISSVSVSCTQQHLKQGAGSQVQQTACSYTHGCPAFDV